MAYTLTLHTRSILLPVVILAITLLYALYEKKMSFSLNFWPAFFAAYFVVKQLLKLYQEGFWKGTPMNSELSGSVSKNLSSMQLDLETIKSVFMIFVGHVFTANIMTFGLYTMAVVAIFMFTFKRFKCADKSERALILSSWVFMGSCIGTSLAQCVTWFQGVYTGVITGTTDWVYSY